MLLFFFFIVSSPVVRRDERLRPTVDGRRGEITIMRARTHHDARTQAASVGKKFKTVERGARCPRSEHSLGSPPVRRAVWPIIVTAPTLAVIETCVITVNNVYCYDYVMSASSS